MRGWRRLRAETSALKAAPSRRQVLAATRATGVWSDASAASTARRLRQDLRRPGSLSVLDVDAISTDCDAASAHRRGPPASRRAHVRRLRGRRRPRRPRRCVHLHPRRVHASARALATLHAEDVGRDGRSTPEECVSGVSATCHPDGRAPYAPTPARRPRPGAGSHSASAGHPSGRYLDKEPIVTSACRDRKTSTSGDVVHAARRPWPARSGSPPAAWAPIARRSGSAQRRGAARTRRRSAHGAMRSTAGLIAAAAPRVDLAVRPSGRRRRLEHEPADARRLDGRRSTRRPRTTVFCCIGPRSTCIEMLHWGNSA